MKTAALTQVAAPSKWEAADQAFERGQQAYLDWCREIAALYAEGTTTQEEIAGRYVTDQQRVSRAVAIGNDARVNTLSITSAPKDKVVLYYLTTLPDKDFEKLCKPTTTQKIILEYKRRLDAPKPAPALAPTRPPCPGVEGWKNGEYYWDHNKWTQVKLKDVPPPVLEIHTSKGRSVLAILEDYIAHTTNEKRIELLKAVRRLEHPDRGGNTELVSEINVLLDKENNHD